MFTWSYRRCHSGKKVVVLEVNCERKHLAHKHKRYWIIIVTKILPTRTSHIQISSRSSRYKNPWWPGLVVFPWGWSVGKSNKILWRISFLVAWPQEVISPLSMFRQLCVLTSELIAFSLMLEVSNERYQVNILWLLRHIYSFCRCYWVLTNSVRSP